MAINNMMRAALNALTYPDLDMKRNYKFARAVVSATHFREKNPVFVKRDFHIKAGNFLVPARTYLPPKPCEPTGLLVFFHGGGWVHGSIDSYDKVCAHMAKITRNAVISVDYRLAPEHPFPQALTDCYSVVRALCSEKTLVGRYSKITLIGDSAGANLAAAVSLLARDRGDFDISRQILLYPSTAADHSETSPFPSVLENAEGYLLTRKRICDYMELYAPSAEAQQSPYFAPLLAKSFERQPHTLIITAEYDPLRDEGEAYGEKLREAGNFVETHRIADALHGFFSLPPSFSHVAQAYDYINDFLKR